MGARTRIELIGSILNVFDTEKVTSICPFENGCVRGTDSVDSAAPLFYQTPRRYELGLRLEL